MDFQFNRPVVIPYETQERFIELLCLDSLEAVNREHGEGEFNYGKGIYVYMNQGNSGEIFFSHTVPIKGVRIIIQEEFYQSYLKQRFPNDYLNVDHLFSMNNKNWPSPELRFIFEQVRRNMSYGTDSELYYESKMAEILFVLSAENSGRWLPRRQNRLKQDDFEAVSRVKDIVATQLSSPPKLSELAFLTGTSVTKLQNDFKTAFGCTIHEYLQKNRMTSALYKIENPDIPLYTISQEIGFKNPSRFSEIFKHTYGVTPTEYREYISHNPKDNAKA
ncbi:MAG: AraC family transcriptional regulator [Synergistaceae bacterium]|jgi:AraC-like DNA-binding protein|nr:AraC family transcriptional regulator [Synergistaceae bacterium]